MRFGEPLDDERFLRADHARRVDPDRDHRRRLRRRRGRHDARPGDRRPPPRGDVRRRRRRPRLLHRRARRPQGLSRASPIRGCADESGYADYLRMATERSLERCGIDSFDLLLLHNPDRIGYTSEAVWKGMAALREAGLTRMIGVAPGPGQRLHARPDRLPRALRRADRLGDDHPQPARAVARRAVPRRRGRRGRQGDHARGRLRRPVLRRRAARARSCARSDHRGFRPAGWIEAGRERLDAMRPIAERAGLTHDPARVPVEPRPRRRWPAWCRR